LAAVVVAALPACLPPAPAAAESSRRYDITKLPAVLDKPLPETLDELKAIQVHVERVVLQVMPAVVNVRVGAQGSGVIISEDGFVLTAGHVSGQPGRECTLTFPDGKQVKAKTLGQNKTADSGLLKITTEGKYPYCEMGKSGDVKKGQWVIALGHPGGLKPGRMPPVRLGRVVAPAGAFITTECTLVGGDSGGPLFDMHGKVIGIHSRIGNSLTANMHVPVDVYRAEWERLAKGESWGGPTGGKGGKGPPKAAAGRLPGVEFAADAKELTVARVVEGSAADKAGLRANDVVLTVNGKGVSTPEDWRAEIARGQPGDAVVIEVRRGGETLKLKGVLDKAA
jgi:serine protease Do